MQSLGMNSMKEFVKVFNKVDDILLKKLAREVGKESVELTKFTNHVALDRALG